VWLPLMVVKVVTTATVLLEVSLVVMTEVIGATEEVGVKVDVDATTDVGVVEDDAAAEDVWNVLVDVSVTVEVDWEVGETVITEVLALEVSEEDVSEEDVSEVEEVPPVLNATLWRFAIAMARSRSLAETDETVRKAKRSEMPSERMLMGGLVRLQMSLREVDYDLDWERTLRLPAKERKKI